MKANITPLKWRVSVSTRFISYSLLYTIEDINKILGNRAAEISHDQAIVEAFLKEKDILPEDLQIIETEVIASGLR